MSDKPNTTSSRSRSEEVETTLDFILEYTKDAPNIQVDISDKLNIRVLQVLAAATVAIGLASRLPADAIGSIGPIPSLGWVDLFFYLAAACYGVVAILAFSHLHTKTYRRSLHGDLLWERYRDYDVDQIKRLLAKDISESYRHNSKVLKQKSRTANFIMIGTALEVLFIVIAFIAVRIEGLSGAAALISAVGIQ